MIPLTLIILTKDEPEAFRLIGRMCEQITTGDRIIVVDDHSAGEFLKILEFYQAAFPFLEVMQHGLNDNFAEHRNFCCRLLPPGQWIIHLDADEWVSPRFLEAIREQITAHPEADCFTLSRINTVHPGNNPIIPPVNWDQPRTMGYQNFPDWQQRVHRIEQYLYWVSPHHTTLHGSINTLQLHGEHFSLIHHKGLYKFDRMHRLAERIREKHPHP